MKTKQKTTIKHENKYTHKTTQIHMKQ